MVNVNGENGFDRIRSQKELLEELQKYKGVINSWMIDYLFALLRLEFSVVREIVSKDEREVLSELEIYKKIAMYNIYYRTQKLLENYELDFEIWNNEQQFHGLIVEKELADGQNVIPFSYKYSLKYGIDELLNGYIKSMYIGEINLCHIIDDEKTYEKLTYKVNKYMEKIGDDPVEKKLKKWVPILKQEVKSINKICTMFLNDYGLTEGEFMPIEKIKSYTEISSNIEKKFVKKIPNLTINISAKHL